MKTGNEEPKGVKEKNKKNTDVDLRITRDTAKNLGIPKDNIRKFDKFLISMC
jgi:hypothetical protein